MQRSTSGPGIAIFTIDRDIHAYAVRHELRRRGVGCAIVEVDALADQGGMSWSPTNEVEASCVRDVDGNQLAIGDLDVIWWRRFVGTPRIPDDVTDEAARDLVINDCRATLLGITLTEFRGEWISHPEATRRAENKLLQLRAAVRAGLRVPRTLVSQDPVVIRRFVEELGGDAIAKVVQGTHKTPVLVGPLTAAMMTDEALRLCPAIYQELVPGTRHLRVCMFGHEAHTVVLETQRLDWRQPLDATGTPYELDQETVGRLRHVLDQLDLKMGIFDLKLLPTGEPVWMEVNPQGQFMFLEAMCDFPVMESFTEYLLAEAHHAASSREQVAAI